MPFKVLKLDQNVSVDGWGNEILYAVTYQQVVAATFTGNNGALQILSSTNTPLEVAADGVPDPETNFADFILFSTGENGRGGFSKNGNVLGACGTYNVDGYDNENCDLDNVFLMNVRSGVRCQVLIQLLPDQRISMIGRVIGIIFRGYLVYASVI